MALLTKQRRLPTPTRSPSSKSIALLADVDMALETTDIAQTYSKTLRTLKQIPKQERTLDWVERAISIYILSGKKVARATSLNNRLARARKLSGEKALYDNFSKKFEQKLTPYRLTNHGKVLPFRHRDVEPILKDLNKLFDVLNHHGYLAFINSGTLLGAIREGGFLLHDDDIDLAVQISGSTPTERIAELRKLGRIVEASGISSSAVKLSRSSPLVKLEIAGDVGVDLFPLWFDEDRAHIWPHTFGELTKDQVFPLGTSNLHGNPMPTPTAPEAMLEINYGPDWRSPDSLFKFDWGTAKERFHDDIAEFRTQSRSLRNKFARMFNHGDRP